MHDIVIGGIFIFYAMIFYLRNGFLQILLATAVTAFLLCVLRDRSLPGSLSIAFISLNNLMVRLTNFCVISNNFNNLQNI